MGPKGLEDDFTVKYDQILGFHVKSCGVYRQRRRRQIDKWMHDPFLHLLVGSRLFKEQHVAGIRRFWGVNDVAIARRC